MIKGINIVLAVLLVFFGQQVMAKGAKGLNLHVPYFNAIYVSDDIQLDVVRGPEQKVVVLNPQAEQPVTAEVVQGTLYLRHPPPVSSCQNKHCSAKQSRYSQPAFVRVYTNSLQGITVCDHSRVKINQLYSYQQFNIVTSGDTKVTLRGNVNLARVITADQSIVDIRWVKSRHVIVRETGQSCVILAGTAGILDARLAQQSELIAQYLRTKNVYVQTSDYAVARVTPIVVLNGFATDHSNILYYKTPTYLTRESHNSANVMQMAYWN